jgi:bifunctional N-acetylglucosamine-1-phosphate-uridyltransferase/glucosamine-1-phosphate-acetyltransferase GlmU-like protein
VKVYRIIRNLFEAYKICGKKLNEVQDYYVSDIRDIKTISEIEPCEDAICLIYDDTPLVTDAFLRRLALKCKKENTAFSIGDGFVSPCGLETKTAECPSVFASRFRPGRYCRFTDAVRRRLIRIALKGGAVILDPDSLDIDFDSEISGGAVIERNVTLRGKTYVGRNAVIGENSYLENAYIGENTQILSSRLCDCRVGDSCRVGPFAFLRMNAKIGDGCRIGDFVEIKNSQLSDGVKTAHLAYIGDAAVGKGTNVGCGTVFCNYDGKQKYRTTVGEKVFIGANTNLIAPVRIGNNAFIAAGSTVTDDVPDSSFVIARSRQTVKIRKK